MVEWLPQQLPSHKESNHDCCHWSGRRYRGAGSWRATSCERGRAIIEFFIRHWLMYRHYHVVSLWYKKRARQRSQQLIPHRSHLSSWIWMAWEFPAHYDGDGSWSSFVGNSLAALGQVLIDFMIFDATFVFLMLLSSGVIEGYKTNNATASIARHLRSIRSIFYQPSSPVGKSTS